MTDEQHHDKFDWATELSDAQGHVTLSKQEAKEIGARLRSMGAKLKTYEDLGDAAEPPAHSGEPVAWLDPWTGLLPSNGHITSPGKGLF